MRQVHRAPHQDRCANRRPSKSRSGRAWFDHPTVSGGVAMGWRRSNHSPRQQGGGRIVEIEFVRLGNARGRHRLAGRARGFIRDLQIDRQQPPASARRHRGLRTRSTRLDPNSARAWLAHAIPISWVRQSTRERQLQEVASGATNWSGNRGSTHGASSPSGGDVAPLSRGNGPNSDTKSCVALADEF